MHTLAASETSEHFQLLGLDVHMTKNARSIASSPICFLCQPKTSKFQDKQVQLDLQRQADPFWVVFQVSGALFQPIFLAQKPNWVHLAKGGQSGGAELCCGTGIHQGARKDTSRFGPLKYLKNIGWQQPGFSFCFKLITVRKNSGDFSEDVSEKLSDLFRETVELFSLLGHPVYELDIKPYLEVVSFSLLDPFRHPMSCLLYMVKTLSKLYLNATHRLLKLNPVSLRSNALNISQSHQQIDNKKLRLRPVTSAVRWWSPVSGWHRWWHVEQIHMVFPNGKSMGFMTFYGNSSTQKRSLRMLVGSIGYTFSSKKLRPGCTNRGQSHIQTGKTLDRESSEVNCKEH